MKQTSYISIKELSEHLGKTTRQIRNLCTAGKIEGAEKIGKQWIIPKGYLDSQNSLSKKFKSGYKLKKLKYNYVIIHGTFGHPGENWFPWLIDQICKLDQSGQTQKEDILIPHFPSSGHADYDSWKSVLMGYIDSGIINKNTIFICHSLGPLFVSKVLIEQQIKVKGMISIEAAANHIMGNEAFDRINKTFFIPSWDYLDKVKKYLDFNYCFYTDNDPHVPYNILKEYVNHASTKSFFIPNAGHFNTASGYTKFPQLLELIKTIENNEVVEEAAIEKIDTPTSLWNKALSHQWTNMTWPNRPSISELEIYTNVLRKTQKSPPIKKSVLLLGSNVEFRDWAYEENLDLSIMQDNEDYHLATYRELRHKNAPYRIMLNDWKQVKTEDKFDFIVGDELIGNLGTSNINKFLEAVSKALKPGGYFLSKSFYMPDNYTPKTLQEIFDEYYSKFDGYNIISTSIFDLTLLHRSKSGFVSFDSIYNDIEKAYKNGLARPEEYEKLSSLGLENMNYKFYIPTVSEYEKAVKKYFEIESILYTKDIGAQNFPIYILRKK